MNLKTQADDLLQIVNMSSGDNYLSGFRDKCRLVIELVSEYCCRNLNYLTTLNTLADSEVANTFSNYKEFDAYSEALRSLEKAINQRLVTTQYDSGFFPECSLQPTEARICNAVDKLVEYLTSLYFGSYSMIKKGNTVEGQKFAIMPMTIFGESSKHETFRHLLPGSKNVLPSYGEHALYGHS